MMSLSPFGQRLRGWRNQRGFSQLDLATRAETTSRHLSFLETGRSRPGKELVLRFASALDVPVRETNALLSSAGLSPVFTESHLDDESVRPIRQALESIVDQHAPYPGSVMNLFGEVRYANATAEAMFPGATEQSAEELMDGFMAPGPGRAAVKNWDEAAWWATDRLRHDAARTQHPRLIALLDRALGHLGDIPRPQTPSSPVIEIRLDIGGQDIRLFSTIVTVDGALDVTMSELKAELLFPMDDVARAFFRDFQAPPKTSSAQALLGAFRASVFWSDVSWRPFSSLGAHGRRRRLTLEGAPPPP